MKKLVGEMSDLLNKIVKFSDDYGVGRGCNRFT